MPKNKVFGQAGGYNGKQGYGSGILWTLSRKKNSTHRKPGENPAQERYCDEPCSKSGRSLIRRARTLELRVHGISQFGCTPLGASFFYPHKYFRGCERTTQERDPLQPNEEYAWYMGRGGHRCEPAESEPPFKGTSNKQRIAKWQKGK